jgi:hypothetical protein
MAASDELSKLAARAKEAEDRTAAARSKAKADLERDVETARTLRRNVEKRAARAFLGLNSTCAY